MFLEAEKWFYVKSEKTMLLKIQCEDGSVRLVSHFMSRSFKTAFNVHAMILDLNVALVSVVCVETCNF